MRAGSKMQAGTPIVFQTFVFTLLLLPLTKGTKGCSSSESFYPAADFGWNIFSLWLTCIGAPPTPKIEGMVKPVQCCFFWVTSLAFGIFPIARYVTAQPPTQGADAGMYDASSEIHKLSTIILYDCWTPFFLYSGVSSQYRQFYFKDAFCL